jgi:transcription elongation factor Elf1
MLTDSQIEIVKKEVEAIILEPDMKHILACGHEIKVSSDELFNNNSVQLRCLVEMRVMNAYRKYLRSMSCDINTSKVHDFEVMNNVHTCKTCGFSVKLSHNNFIDEIVAYGKVNPDLITKVQKHLNIRVD